MGKMGRGTPVGPSLTLLGLALLLICSIPITSTGGVIDASFTVSPGTKYGPYDAGTVYHTRIGMKILSKSVLKGEVFVEVEGIYLTVGGYNTKALKNIYVKGRYSFIVDPAHDQYTFIFDNSKGDAESLVKFKLEEVWTRPVIWTGPNGSVSLPLFIAGIIGFFLFLVGLVTLAIIHFKPWRGISKTYANKSPLARAVLFDHRSGIGGHQHHSLLASRGGGNRNREDRSGMIVMNH